MEDLVLYDIIHQIKSLPISLVVVYASSPAETDKLYSDIVLKHLYHW